MLNNKDQSTFSELQSKDETDQLDVSLGLPFTIVGIGASAGGLEAFTQLLSALPADTGMAFLLVQHLDAGHDSQLAEILSTATKMPVRQAAEAMAIEPNSVYVIPPDSNIGVAGKAIRLTPRVPHKVNMPVDWLFESLASGRGENSIGVVLSGNGTDGSLGLQAIKNVGGITFVQLESTAQFAGMPHSASASGAANFALSPADIAKELVSISHNAYLIKSPADQTPEPFSHEEAEVQKIFQLVYTSTGVDFSHYKQAMSRRRIGRRMVVRRSRNSREYLAYLESHPEEIADLYRDLLISVSCFFRDPDSFVALENCLRATLKNKASSSVFRVWVPGCAGGEEVYSLAICLDELFKEAEIRPTLQIFGTDISEASLRTARAGIYPAKISQDISAERLQRYFRAVNGDYEVIKSIRNSCVFAKQDLTRDPPFSRVDLISCRNTLIYLDSSLQRRVLSVLHYSLTEEGLLLLGSAETTGESSGLFRTLDLKHKIYVRENNAASRAIIYPLRRAGSIPPPIGKAPPTTTAAWRKQSDQLIQDRYAPDGVVVNQDMTVLQMRGRTGYYLQSTAVGATQNLLLLAHDSLQQPLREAALSAIAQNVAVQRKGLHFEFQGEDREINLEIIPLSLTSDKERFYFIVLERANAVPVVADDPPPAIPETPEQVIFRLKEKVAELNDIVRNLTSTYEGALEEQTASNEEISSANEELQSANEELTTAKEEVQSANQELMTMNDELGNRNQEVKRSLENSEKWRNYAEGIVNTLRQPLLVLDGQLRVKTANTPFCRLFPVSREQIVGRFIYDLGNGEWNVPALKTLLEKILPQSGSFEDFEIVHNSAALGRRTLLLNARQLLTADNQLDLVLMAIEDVTERRRLHENLQASNEDLQRFAYAAAHDLRAPLTSAVRLSRILAEGLAGKLDEFESEMLTLFIESMGRLRKLMEDILVYSDMGNTREHLEVMPVAEPLEIALANLQAEIESSAAQISVGALPTLPVDSSRLAMIFQNLIDNAVKYRRSEVPRIEISAVNLGSHWRISVKDNGQGFSSTYASRVFEPFKRLSQSDVPGSGIGLATCKRIVERLGGTIWAESIPGKGSCFHFTLPAAASSAATAG